MSELLKNGLPLLLQVSIMFVMIFAGAAATRFKLINREGNDKMINVLLYIVTPALIIDSFASIDFTPQRAIELLIATGCAVLTHIVGIAFSFIFTKEKDKARKAVLKFAPVFSNGGFMALPLASALFGADGVFYGSAYVIIFNIMQWTYGVTLFPKNAGTPLTKTLINPGTVGVILGLPIFILGIDLPSIIASPVEQIAGMNTPLAMLVTGYFVATSDLKKGLTSPSLWLVCLLRLLVIPTCMLIIFKYGFSLYGTLLCCCVLPASAPCAVNTMVLASKFGGDEDFGLKLLSISTILSVITMPLLLSLAQI